VGLPTRNSLSPRCSECRISGSHFGDATW
jgi:hypothetical protein